MGRAPAAPQGEAKPGQGRAEAAPGTDTATGVAVPCCATQHHPSEHPGDLQAKGRLVLLLCTAKAKQRWQQPPLLRAQDARPHPSQHRGWEEMGVGRVPDRPVSWHQALPVTPPVMARPSLARDGTHREAKGFPTVAKIQLSLSEHVLLGNKPWEQPCFALRLSLCWLPGRGRRAPLAPGTPATATGLCEPNGGSAPSVPL